MFPSVGEVVENIANSDIPLHPSALFHLSGLGPRELRNFSERWPQVDLKRRRWILRWLVQIAEENFEVDFNSIFRHCLGDPDAQVRALAIDGLWEVEGISLLARLLDLLEGDPSELVRGRAAIALGRFALLAELGKLEEDYALTMRAALLGCIRNPKEAVEVRRRAVESVSYFGGEEIRGVIANAYVDDEEEMRQSAVFAMGRSLDSYWLDAVLSELSNPKPAMRYEAARACGELEMPDAVEPLIELVDNMDIEVSCAAIWALGQIGGEEAREALKVCCESEDTSVAEAAEEALLVLEFSRSLPEVPLRSWVLGDEEE